MAPDFFTLGNVWERDNDCFFAIIMQNQPDIRNQISRKDLFDAFKTQLSKDFEQSNFPAGFVDTLTPDYLSILETITLELERNEKRTDANIMQLLYRIDINEAQLKRHLNNHKDESHLKLIAELIIKRVLQKIVIKQYYKNTE